MLASVCSMCWSWVGWWGRVHVVMADWAVHGGRVGAQYKRQLNSIWVPLWDGGMERVSENQGVPQTVGCRICIQNNFNLFVHRQCQKWCDSTVWAFSWAPIGALQHWKAGTLVELQCCCNNGLGLNSRPLFATLVHMCAYLVLCNTNSEWNADGKNMHNDATASAVARNLQLGRGTDEHLFPPPLPNRFHPYFHSVFFCASKHWIWQKLRFTQGLAI